MIHGFFLKTVIMIAPKRRGSIVITPEGFLQASPRCSTCLRRLSKADDAEILEVESQVVEEVRALDAVPDDAEEQTASGA